MRVTLQALFETRSIDAIRVIEREKKTEIERKNSELRDVVGRRAMDLCQSAESVLLIRDRTRALVGHLADVQGMWIMGM